MLGVHRESDAALREWAKRVANVELKEGEWSTESLRDATTLAYFLGNHFYPLYFEGPEDWDTLHPSVSLDHFHNAVRRPGGRPPIPNYQAKAKVASGGPARDEQDHGTSAADVDDPALAQDLRGGDEKTKAAAPTPLPPPPLPGARATSYLPTMAVHASAMKEQLETLQRAFAQNPLGAMLQHEHRGGSTAANLYEKETPPELELLRAQHQYEDMMATLQFSVQPLPWHIWGVDAGRQLDWSKEEATSTQELLLRERRQKAAMKSGSGGGGGAASAAGSWVAGGKPEVQTAASVEAEALAAKKSASLLKKILKKENKKGKTSKDAVGTSSSGKAPAALAPATAIKATPHPKMFLHLHVAQNKAWQMQKLLTTKLSQTMNKLVKDRVSNWVHVANDRAGASPSAHVNEVVYSDWVLYDWQKSISDDDEFSGASLDTTDESPESGGSDWPKAAKKADRRAVVAKARATGATPKATAGQSGVTGSGAGGAGAGAAANAKGAKSSSGKPPLHHTPKVVPPPVTNKLAVLRQKILDGRKAPGSSPLLQNSTSGEGLHLGPIAAGREGPTSQTNGPPMNHHDESAHKFSPFSDKNYASPSQSFGGASSPAEETPLRGPLLGFLPGSFKANWAEQALQDEETVLLLTAIRQEKQVGSLKEKIRYGLVPEVGVPYVQTETTNAENIDSTATSSRSETRLNSVFELLERKLTALSAARGTEFFDKEHVALFEDGLAKRTLSPPNFGMVQRGHMAGGPGNFPALSGVTEESGPANLVRFQAWAQWYFEDFAGKDPEHATGPVELLVDAAVEEVLANEEDKEKKDHTAADRPRPAAPEGGAAAATSTAPEVAAAAQQQEKDELRNRGKGMGTGSSGTTTTKVKVALAGGPAPGAGESASASASTVEGTTRGAPPGESNKNAHTRHFADHLRSEQERARADFPSSSTTGSRGLSYAAVLQKIHENEYPGFKGRLATSSPETPEKQDFDQTLSQWRLVSLKGYHKQAKLLGSQLESCANLERTTTSPANKANPKAPGDKDNSNRTQRCTRNMAQLAAEIAGETLRSATEGGRDENQPSAISLLAEHMIYHKKAANGFALGVAAIWFWVLDVLVDVVSSSVFRLNLAVRADFHWDLFAYEFKSYQAKATALAATWEDLKTIELWVFRKSLFLTELSTVMSEAAVVLDEVSNPDKAREYLAKFGKTTGLDAGFQAQAAATSVPAVPVVSTPAAAKARKELDEAVAEAVAQLEGAPRAVGGGSRGSCSSGEQCAGAAASSASKTTAEEKALEVCSSAAVAMTKTMKEIETAQNEWPFRFAVELFASIDELKKAQKGRKLFLHNQFHRVFRRFESDLGLVANRGNNAPLLHAEQLLRELNLLRADPLAYFRISPKYLELESRDGSGEGGDDLDRIWTTTRLDQTTGTGDGGAPTSAPGGAGGGAGPGGCGFVCAGCANKICRGDVAGQGIAVPDAEWIRIKQEFVRERIKFLSEAKLYVRQLREAAFSSNVFGYERTAMEAIAALKKSANFVKLGPGGAASGPGAADRAAAAALGAASSREINTTTTSSAAPGAAEVDSMLRDRIRHGVYVYFDEQGGNDVTVTKAQLSTSDGGAADFIKEKLTAAQVAYRKRTEVLRAIALWRGVNAGGAGKLEWQRLAVDELFRTPASEQIPHEVSPDEQPAWILPQAEAEADPSSQNKNRYRGARFFYQNAHKYRNGRYDMLTVIYDTVTGAQTMYFEDDVAHAMFEEPVEYETNDTYPPKVDTSKNKGGGPPKRDLLEVEARLTSAYPVIEVNTLLMDLEAVSAGQMERVAKKLVPGNNGVMYFYENTVVFEIPEEERRRREKEGDIDVRKDEWTIKSAGIPLGMGLMHMQDAERDPASNLSSGEAPAEWADRIVEDMLNGGLDDYDEEDDGHRAHVHEQSGEQAATTAGELPDEKDLRSARTKSEDERRPREPVPAAKRARHDQDEEEVVQVDEQRGPPSAGVLELPHHLQQLTDSIATLSELDVATLQAQQEEAHAEVQRASAKFVAAMTRATRQAKEREAITGEPLSLSDESDSLIHLVREAAAANGKVVQELCVEDVLEDARNLIKSAKNFENAVQASPAGVLTKNLASSASKIVQTCVEEARELGATAGGEKNRTQREDEEGGALISSDERGAAAPAASSGDAKVLARGNKQTFYTEAASSRKEQAPFQLKKQKETKGKPATSVALGPQVDQHAASGSASSVPPWRKGSTPNPKAKANAKPDVRISSITGPPGIEYSMDPSGKTITFTATQDSGLLQKLPAVGEPKNPSMRTTSSTTGTRTLEATATGVTTLTKKQMKQLQRGKTLHMSAKLEMKAPEPRHSTVLSPHQDKDLLMGQAVADGKVSRAEYEFFRKADVAMGVLEGEDPIPPPSGLWHQVVPRMPRLKDYTAWTLDVAPEFTTSYSHVPARFHPGRTAAGGFVKQNLFGLDEAKLQEAWTRATASPPPPPPGDMKRQRHRELNNLRIERYKLHIAGRLANKELHEEQEQLKRVVRQNATAVEGPEVRVTADHARVIPLLAHTGNPLYLSTQLLLAPDGYALPNVVGEDVFTSVGAEVKPYSPFEDIWRMLAGGMGENVRQNRSPAEPDEVAKNPATASGGGKGQGRGGHCKMTPVVGPAQGQGGKGGTKGGNGPVDVKTKTINLGPEEETPQTAVLRPRMEIDIHASSPSSPEVEDAATSSSSSGDASSNPVAFGLVDQVGVKMKMGTQKEQDEAVDSDSDDCPKVVDSELLQRTMAAIYDSWGVQKNARHHALTAPDTRTDTSTTAPVSEAEAALAKEGVRITTLSTDAVTGNRVRSVDLPKLGGGMEHFLVMESVFEGEACLNVGPRSAHEQFVQDLLSKHQDLKMDAASEALIQRVCQGEAVPEEEVNAAADRQGMAWMQELLLERTFYAKEWELPPTTFSVRQHVFLQNGLALEDVANLEEIAGNAQTGVVGLDSSEADERLTRYLQSEKAEEFLSRTKYITRIRLFKFAEGEKPPRKAKASIRKAQAGASEEPKEQKDDGLRGLYKRMGGGLVALTPAASEAAPAPAGEQEEEAPETESAELQIFQLPGNSAPQFQVLREPFDPKESTRMLTTLIMNGIAAAGSDSATPRGPPQKTEAETATVRPPSSLLFRGNGQLAGTVDRDVDIFAPPVDRIDSESLVVVTSFINIEVADPYSVGGILTDIMSRLKSSENTRAEVMTILNHLLSPEFLEKRTQPTTEMTGSTGSGSAPTPTYGACYANWFLKAWRELGMSDRSVETVFFRDSADSQRVRSPVPLAHRPFYFPLHYFFDGSSFDAREWRTIRKKISLAHALLHRAGEAANCARETAPENADAAVPCAAPAPAPATSSPSPSDSARVVPRYSDVSTSKAVAGTYAGAGARDTMEVECTPVVDFERRSPSKEEAAALRRGKKKDNCAPAPVVHHVAGISPAAAKAAQGQLAICSPSVGRKATLADLMGRPAPAQPPTVVASKSEKKMKKNKKSPAQAACTSATSAAAVAHNCDGRDVGPAGAEPKAKTKVKLQVDSITVRGVEVEHGESERLVCELYKKDNRVRAAAHSVFDSFRRVQAEQQDALLLAGVERIEDLGPLLPVPCSTPPQRSGGILEARRWYGRQLYEAAESVEELLSELQEVAVKMPGFEAGWTKMRQSTQKFDAVITKKILEYEVDRRSRARWAGKTQNGTSTSSTGEGELPAFQSETSAQSTVAAPEPETEHKDKRKKKPKQAKQGPGRGSQLGEMQRQLNLSLQRDPKVQEKKRQEKEKRARLHKEENEARLEKEMRVKQNVAEFNAKIEAERLAKKMGIEVPRARPGEDEHEQVKQPKQESATSAATAKEKQDKLTKAERMQMSKKTGNTAAQSGAAAAPPPRIDTNSASAKAAAAMSKPISPPAVSLIHRNGGAGGASSSAGNTPSHRSAPSLPDAMPEANAPIPKQAEQEGESVSLKRLHNKKRKPQKLQKMNLLV
eukprot:g4761.t1